jgi:RNA polymerase sigma-70 factor (ECF subfamily)
MSKQGESSDWVARLCGRDQKEAIKELSHILMSSLGNFNLSYEDKEDIVQESLAKILTNIGSYQRRSTFVSWAIAINVNEALNRVRKVQWKNVSIEDAATLGIELESAPGSSSSPDSQSERSWALSLVEKMILEEITPKQRLALLAEINGMPLQEIASRMNITRGAIYKLTFDARKRLLKKLAQRGFSVEDLLRSEG